ncbi:M6 family metalloprotease domain-containing protein [Streptomyces sp. TLI_105]|uniref:M6 family metalloprotease domain-containing protein n=1 Tax=Streptomyces sp. TLI_105 TaxID=1881019 RepID=UPI000896CE3C|nr:M6 family metalloprotease domain-containing protein [Streptomyces sp. TLI_105]SEB89040.1 M6 family metalloprotease domain-containing protein [Streptomyces sp. TLI_105]
MPATNPRPRPLAAALALASFLALAPAAHATPLAATTSRPIPAARTADCELPGRTGWTDEGHDTDHVQFQPATGTRRVLNLFVDFPDAPATDATEPYAAHLAPAVDWMRTASHGRLRLSVDFLHQWIRMPADSTTYHFARGLTFEAHEKYVRDAIAAADPYADLSRYDMVYIVPVRTAAAIPFSPTYLYDPATPGVTADGTRLKWAVTFGQDMWRWGHKVAAHETGHTFGLPDLYSFTGPTHQYVGGWDVMGDIAGAAPQFLGWHSWKLGWIRDDQVACLAGPGRRTVHLAPVERPGGTKIAVLRTGETTAYVAESRHPELNDASACSSGVLIYRIDSATPTGEGPVRIVNGNPTGIPPAGCTPLDLAAHRPGRTFTDPATGVRIDVRADGPAGDVVTLSAT